MVELLEEQVDLIIYPNWHLLKGLNVLKVKIVENLPLPVQMSTRKQHMSILHLQKKI